MMAENEDWSLPLLADAADVVNQKRVKFSYTTDFLLSLSDLDICKQPPSGFDPSILSDCQEVTQSAPEWRRPYGSSALQISKRGENGLSSGTWVESSGNSSRLVYDKTAFQTSGSLGQGRWEGRAGIVVHGNGDQQFEKGPVAQDSSRRYGNQSRQSWQSPERDGLLGSGDFPRPSVHAGGPLSPKVRGNGQYQLNRSTEPYQPPWMYKPALQSRRDATDLCNDETFGSSECLSQDKAEEEKRRRASFEIMRKEQHKALQEKLKQPSGKQNIDLPYLDASENEVNIQVDIGVDDHVELPQKDHAKLPVLQVSASRPLVPPGFASTVLDKNQITRTPTLPAESDIFKSGRSTAVEECLDTAGALHMSREVVGQIQEKYLATDLEASAKQHEVDGSISASMNGTEKPVATLLPSEVSQSPLVLQTTQNEFQGKTDDVLTNFAPAKAAGFESKTGASPEGSTSILEKLFGSAMRVNDAGSPDPSEASVEKVDEEPWNPVTQSSKFAHWFCEEEVKPAVDQPPSTAEDLLSLFASNEKGIAYNTEIKELNKAGTIIPPEEATNIQEHVVQPLPTSVGSVSEPSHSEKLDVRSGVLTCEDLEQYILAEANASQTNIESFVKVFSNVPNLGSEQLQTDVDNQASQHLLSLLQKGTTLKDSIATNKAEEIAAVPSAQPISVDGVQLLEKTLTLESLFGTAFMQELQSVEAPVSVQRASGGVRTTTDLDMPGAAFIPFDIKPAGKISRDSIPVALIHGGERSYDTSKASWLGFDGRKDGIKSEVAPSLGFENEPADDTVDIHLPEEDSLITVSSAPPNEAPAFLSSGIASKEEILLSSAMPVDIMEKLTGLDNALRDDRSMIPAIDHRPLQEVLRGPFNMMGPEFQHQQRLLGGQSLPHVPMNPLRPPYSQLEQELNRHPERFMGPTDNGFDLRHHFPPNVLQHPFHHNAGIPARFEPDHHQAMQHMVPGNLPGPHPLQPLPGGLPLQHQHGLGPFNNAPFMPDIHSVQGFPFHHRPPNFNAMEVPVPGTAGRSGHPEGLERLIEMELRANANKKPPFVPNPGGPFGPEIDMAYRYRC